MAFSRWGARAPGPSTTAPVDLFPVPGAASNVHEGESHWYEFYWAETQTGAVTYVLLPAVLGTATLSVYTYPYGPPSCESIDLLCSAGGLVSQCVAPGNWHLIQVFGVQGMRVCDNFLLGLIGCLPISSDIPYALFARPAITI